MRTTVVLVATAFVVVGAGAWLISAITRDNAGGSDSSVLESSAGAVGSDARGTDSLELLYSQMREVVGKVVVRWHILRENGDMVKYPAARHVLRGRP